MEIVNHHRQQRQQLQAPQLQQLHLRQRQQPQQEGGLKGSWKKFHYSNFFI